METIKQYIVKELKEQRKMLDGGDFDHWFDGYNSENEPISSMVNNADIDSDEFNIGFEQRYMFAMRDTFAEVIRQQGACAICGKPMRGTVDIHHHFEKCEKCNGMITAKDKKAHVCKKENITESDAYKAIL